jgi:hypothetical protein
MSKDLEILKKIEKKLGIELEKVDKELFKKEHPARGYCTDDDDNNIMGLDLFQLKISDISALKDLQNLTRLSLGGNQISNISSLKDLQKLTLLHLYHNQISDISALKDLQNLTDLQLSENQISDISALKDLQKLTLLTLRDNRLTTLPGWITELGLELKWEGAGGDKVMYLSGNPLESPPAEIVKQGTEAVRAYFRSLEGEKQALNEVKVLLVGDGAAGKTSLVKRLTGQGYDENEPQTHGININHWEVPEGENKIKARLWDFGGQEIMHATHQFFLSKRSLYVLVLDGRKDEKTEYWLKHIESFGGDSPILVVINKIDENPSFDLNRPFLQEKYKGIKAFYRISCQTKDGIDTFSKGLTEELANVDLIHTPWGQSWFNVKNRLEEMDEHFIDYERYKNICLEEGIDDKISQDTLVGFLNDLGVILNIKEFELEDVHVLDPKWATGAVYKIINSEKLAESKGILRLSDLKEILAKRKEGDYDYPRKRHPYIIGLMKKFELCYELPDSKTVLIPDLLDVTRPEFEFDYKSSLSFVIEYDFLPRSVIPRFIVKKHLDIKGSFQWRTGCVLEDKSSKSTAVIRADNEAKKIEIFVNGDHIERKDYFANILYSFREINDSFEKLKVTELVPLPDNPEVTVEYEHLKTLASMKKNKFIPQGSKKEYKASDLLGIVQFRKDNEEEVLNLFEKFIKEIKDKNLDDKIKDKKSFFKVANKIIDLKPKILGVGINVNEILDVLAEKYFEWKKSRQK